MRLPVSAWIALHTVSEHRRYARLVQSTHGLVGVERVHRGLQRPRQWSAKDRDTTTISIIGRGIVGQQWRQRQAGPRALGLRAESVNGQDLQGRHAEMAER